MPQRKRYIILELLFQQATSKGYHSCSRQAQVKAGSRKEALHTFQFIEIATGAKIELQLNWFLNLAMNTIQK